MASRDTKAWSASSEMISISDIRDMQTKPTMRYCCTAVATGFTNSGSRSLTKIAANCFQYILQWTRSVSRWVLTSTANGLYQGIYHFHNQIVREGQNSLYFFPFSKLSWFLQTSITLRGLPWGSDGKESASNAADPGWIPEWGRSPGERNGNPFQYSCLEKPMDRRAWQATVHGVGMSWTQLSD